jgi:hypothetical protein
MMNIGVERQPRCTLKERMLMMKDFNVWVSLTRNKDIFASLHSILSAGGASSLLARAEPGFRIRSGGVGNATWDSLLELAEKKVSAIEGSR